MLFQFAPAVQAAIHAGKYVQVFTSAGVPIGMARDPVTGQFVAHAIGAVVNNSPLSPLVAASQFATSGAQMYQMHRGFQAIQTSLGVLQATTALIGVGTVAVGALAAVNLYQTLRLRKEVGQLRLEVKEGFIDLKKALKDQGAEILQRLDEVAQNVEFRQHRTILVQAYGRFLEATKLMKTAMSCQDLSVRNNTLANAQLILVEALADYNNPQLFSKTCAAGQLRRLECAWAIDQTIALTYQLQNEPAAVSDHLSHLQDKIRQDSLTVINCCETEDELDFLFPELTRIHDHDLAVLESWQNQVDWLRTLPSSELKLLQSADFSNSEVTVDSEGFTNTATLSVPPEQLLYENLKQKSHLYSLRTQLEFLIQPTVRREREAYISEQAAKTGYKTLVPTNLQKASDLTVANLYWYFIVGDEPIPATNVHTNKATVDKFRSAVCRKKPRQPLANWFAQV